MFLKDTEARNRDDVSFRESAEGADAAIWCCRAARDISQLSLLSYAADFLALDSTVTPIGHQYADYFESASTVGTAMPRYWLDTLSFIEYEQSLVSQTREANSLFLYCLLQLYKPLAAHRRLQLEQELVAKYGQFEQVEKIHLVDSAEGMQVFVWLHQVKYDDELMDRLLDQEWSLLHRFPENPFEVFYFPLPADGAELPIPDGARAVFG
jgi:hypothetical protein